MADNGHEQTILGIRRELASIHQRARSVCVRSQNSMRQAEAAKVESMRKMIEGSIKSKARLRGMVSVRKDPRLLKSSILVTAGASILGGLLTRDGWGALNSGLSSFDEALQRFGRAEWTVLLGRRIIVAASDSTPTQKPWLAWGILKTALEELQKEASAGEALGNLDDVLHRLEQRQGWKFIPVKQMTGQPESK